MLQQQFNQHIFVLEQRIYESEGLDWSVISFRDNQAIIDMIGKRPRGLLPICEEHVMLSAKRAADNNALVQAYHNAHALGDKVNEFYAKPRFQGPDFIINHFAGPVSYDTTSFIQKNKDALNEELKEMLVASDNPFFISLFAKADDARRTPDSPGYIEIKDDGIDGLAAGIEEEDEAEEYSITSKASRGSTMKSRGSTMKKGGRLSQADTKGTFAAAYSVSMRFREQLDTLTLTLRSTAPHYIKCIKPNGIKASMSVSAKLIVDQLRYSGVLEVVRIRREAYPTRLLFNEVHMQFEQLARAFYIASGRGPLPDAKTASEEDSKAATMALMEEYLPDTGFQIGKTKAFLRNGMIEELIDAQKWFFHKRAVKIQAVMRGKLSRSSWTRTLRATIKAQCMMRRYLARYKYVKYCAAKTMQSVVRRFLARVRFNMFRSKAAAIQALVRMRKGVAVYEQQQKAAVYMQKLGRRLVVQNHYGKHADQRAAAVMVAKLARRMIAKRKYAKDIVEVRAASAKIAAVVRRKQELTRYQTFLKAVVVWQTGARGKIARKKFSSLQTLDRLRREKEKKKATMMQAQWRRHVASSEYAGQRAAVTKIATLHRKRKATNDLAIALKAAIRLATVARRRAAHRRYLRFLQRLVVVQCQARRLFARNRQAEKRAAIARTQRAAHAWLRNRHLQDAVRDIHMMAEAGNLDGVNQVMVDVMDEIPDIRHVRDRHGNFRSVVMTAAHAGSLAVVSGMEPTESELLETDAQGNRPLHLACGSLNLDLIKFLVSTEVPDDFDSFGNGDLTSVSHTRTSWTAGGGGNKRRPTMTPASPTGTARVRAASKATANRPGGTDFTADVDANKEVRAGWLKKRRETDRYAKRWCVLTSTELHYYHNEKAKGKPSMTVQLKDVMLKRCPTEDCTFVIFSDKLMGSGRNNKNKEGLLKFQAESEVVFNEWYTDLRHCCGKTENVRMKRAKPMLFVKTLERGDLLMLRNDKGHTALHCATFVHEDDEDERANRMSSSVSNAAVMDGSLSKSLQTCVWLVENGCMINAQDDIGNTALHYAVSTHNMICAAAMVKKGANLSIKNEEQQTALDLTHSEEEVQALMVGQYNQSQRFELLPAPDKLTNCTYVSMFFDKLNMQSTDSLISPFLTLKVYLVKDKKFTSAEEPQDIVEPAVTRGDYLWWGSTYHMQTPLENLTTGAVILVELKDVDDGKGERMSMVGGGGGGGAGTARASFNMAKGGGASKKNKDGTVNIAWAILDVSKQTINTSVQHLELFEYPVDLKKEKEVILSPNADPKRESQTRNATSNLRTLTLNRTPHPQMVPADMFLGGDLMLTQVESLRDSELWVRDENNRGRALGSRPFGSAYTAESVPEDEEVEGGAADDETASNTAANSTRGASARYSTSYRSSRSSRSSRASTPRSDDGRSSVGTPSPKRASRRESVSLADEIMKLNDMVQNVSD